MCKDPREQTLFKFVKGYYRNYHICQMNDNCNQEIFKAIEKIRNKHKHQPNVESSFEQIIKTFGKESISKAYPENRRKTLVTEDMLENTPRLEKEKNNSKQLLLNIDGDITEPLMQSQDTPTKSFTACETESYGNDLLAFK